MEQIDAATVIRILVAAAPPDTLEPTIDAMRFAENGVRSGHFHLEGFRNGSPEPEPIPVGHTCALDFDWLARASKVDDQLGEADLITPPFGRTLACEPRWLDLRFSRTQIEGAKSNFVASLGGRGRSKNKGGAPRIFADDWLRSAGTEWIEDNGVQLDPRTGKPRRGEQAKLIAHLLDVAQTKEWECSDSTAKRMARDLIAQAIGGPKGR